MAFVFRPDNACPMQNKRRCDPLLLVVGIFTASLPTALLFASVTYLFAATLLAGVITVGLSFFKPNRRRRIVGIGLCILAIVGSFWLIIDAGRSGAPIKLIVPNDYVGEINIYYDKRTGLSPEEADGFWVYRINDDGTFVTSSDRPFLRFHQERVEFRDGRVILDDTHDVFENLGYRVTGDGVLMSGDDPRPDYRWKIERTKANETPTSAPTNEGTKPYR